MSKHVGRKEQWTKVSPTRHLTYNGYTQQNPQGKWVAVVTYMTRPLLKKDDKKLWSSLRKNVKNEIHAAFYQKQLEAKQPPREWYTKRTTVGEFNRAREAMMAVEQYVKELRSQNNPDILL